MANWLPYMHGSPGENDLAGLSGVLESRNCDLEP